MNFFKKMIDFTDKDYTENIISDNNKVLGKRVSLTEFGRKSQMLNKGIRKNPIVPGAADFIQGMLYDRYTAAAASALPALVQWFTVPQGQQGKTKADTNMTLTQQLPQPQWINVVNMGLYLSTQMRLTDIQTWFNTYWMEFWVQDKIYLEGPEVNFPAQGSLSGTWSFAAGTDQSIFSNGNGTVFNGFDMRLPAGLDLGGIATDGATGIIINSAQNFHVDSKGTSFNLAAASGLYGGFNVVCNLQGILSRQVQ